ncbi:MAG: polyhydroxyalkanoic acid system family protein [Geodermatophilaceae bacterium]|nr:polyhydroxyalkanoic acid system family protein [Geodermatophilaceae bacterium]
MASVDITRQHDLGVAEAKQRAQPMLDDLKSSFGVSGAWEGDQFVITQPAKGSLDVTDTTVRVQVDLPLFLRPMKGVVEAKVNESLDEALAAQR